MGRQAICLMAHIAPCRAKFAIQMVGSRELQRAARAVTMEPLPRGARADTFRQALRARPAIPAPRRSKVRVWTMRVSWRGAPSVTMDLLRKESQLRTSRQVRRARRVIVPRQALRLQRSIIPEQHRAAHLVITARRRAACPGRTSRRRRCVRRVISVRCNFPAQGWTTATLRPIASSATMESAPAENLQDISRPAKIAVLVMSALQNSLAHV